MNLFGSNTEQHILEMFQKDESRAMDILYGEYADYLAGVCARYVTNQEDLHDVLQEGFIKIFTKITSFEYRGKGSLRAWLTRVVVNESLLFLRDKNKNLIVDDEMPNTVQSEEPQIAGLSEDEILGLIAKLPVGYRTVFNLYVVEGNSHKEIAELLGIKADTSASQFHKAKTMLAKMIVAYKKEKENR